jgi:uncharacterized protein YrrD
MFKDLIEYKIQAEDAPAGMADDILFDDRNGDIRYIAVSFRFFLFFKRTVNIQPKAVSGIDGEKGLIFLTIKKESVQQSTGIKRIKPVSEIKEKEFNDYYSVPEFWSGSGEWKKNRVPSSMPKSEGTEMEEKQDLEKELYGLHLRSGREICGYELRMEEKGRTGTTGTIDDFVIDSESWKITEFVVRKDGAAENIPTGTIASIHWIEKAVYEKPSQ